MAAADMPVISDLLVRKEVLCLEAIRPLMPRLMADPENLEPRGENNFSHVSMKNVAYTAGRLYVLDHPDNPYRGDEEILAMCLELADAWCTRYEACRRAGAPMDTTEWPCYIMTQLIQMLPPEKIGPERTSRWKENLEIWCDMMVPKPFFFTSPNHEAWKCMVLWTAGEVLGRPDYQ